MIFSSYSFIFVFLPITVFLYYMVGKFNNFFLQKMILLIASLVFYSWTNVRYALLIISSILVNYFIAKQIKKDRSCRINKTFFVIGILFNILLLFYFKYVDFFIDTVNSLLRTNIGLLGVVLPIGISFFTFQQISFLVSVYKNKQPIGNIIDYSLFVSFFPQLIAGPIVTYDEMMPQFENKDNHSFNYHNFSLGIYIFTIGLFKKIVLADSLALIATNGFDNYDTICLIPAWITSIAYTFQIFFDFSGYSDMAIGLGHMFNISLSLNFDQPYKSKSIQEFWRRWHITLGRTLTTYVYYPLGGNRKGDIRTYINLLVVFFISGLWHGASWTFVVWGLLHGMASVLERVFKKQIVRIPKVIRVLFTFVFLNFTWVLFNAKGWTQAIGLYKGMLGFNGIGNPQSIISLGTDGIAFVPSIITIGIMLITFIVSVVLIVRMPNTKKLETGFTPTIRNVLLTSSIFSFCVIHLIRVSPFIYFNF